MLEAYFLDHKWVLAAITLSLTGVNVLLVWAGLRLFANQQRIRQEEFVPPGLAGRARSARGRALLPLVGVAVFLTASSWLDREGFGAIAGGLLVAQAAAVGLSLSTLLNLRALRDPAAATGQLTYSAAYRYSASGNQMLGCALLVWLLFCLRGGPMLFGGGVFLLALAAGNHRRSRQARRLAPIPSQA